MNQNQYQSSQKDRQKKKVVIAMSGGVDSSVAAAILQQDGYDVIGVTMEIFDGSTKGAESAHHACFGPGETQDVEDASRVAGALGIPYHTVNLRQAYRRNILDYFMEGYRQGSTPNPCAKCNHDMKFGAIGKELEKMGIEYDYFATGHYARIEYDKGSNQFHLKKAVDQNKDQTYFLFNLEKERLASTLFPLGNMTKEKVRDVARSFSLSVSDKQESQDFVAGGYQQLFSSGTPGPIVHTNGKILGQHRGLEFFTIGQRKGIGISASEPLYVISKIPASNTVVVGPRETLLGNQLLANQVNWFSDVKLNSAYRFTAKIRLRHKEAMATVIPLENRSVRVEFDEPQSAITPGQVVVFYNEDTVVGGGIIAKGIE